MATFPSELAGTLNGASIEETLKSNLVVTENAIGQEQSRPKTTSQIVQYANAQFVMSVSQYAIWRSFHRSIIRFGSLPFDMVDPISGITKSFKLAQGGVYTARSIGKDVWQVTCTLEFVDR
jgi:hypothetical protein